MSSMDIASAPIDAARERKVSTRIWQQAFASVEFRIGLVVLALLIAAALLYPQLSGIDPTKMNIKAKLTPPLFMGEGWTWAHPLGTDQLGRDMLVRALVGLRYSLLIGVSTTVLMLPKVGVGGCTPRPRKPSTDSKIIIRAMSSTATKAIGGSTSGRISANMIRQSVAPSTMAPRTYSFLRSDITVERMTRA